jgi:hypothetical protein
LRNTEFSTCRAAGDSPNDTFDTPSVVAQPGTARLDALDGLERLQRVAPQVLLPGPEREGQAVEDEVVGLEPVLVDRDAGDPLAHATFQSAVRAWPSSSIASTTTAAP